MFTKWWQEMCSIPKHTFHSVQLLRQFVTSNIVLSTAKTRVKILTLYGVYLEQQIININRCSI